MTTPSKNLKAQSLDEAMKEYLARNPQIRTALELFHVSDQMYANLLEANRPPKVTTTSTTS